MMLVCFLPLEETFLRTQNTAGKSTELGAETALPPPLLAAQPAQAIKTVHNNNAHVSEPN